MTVDKECEKGRPMQGRETADRSRRGQAEGATNHESEARGGARNRSKGCELPE